MEDACIDELGSVGQAILEAFRRILLSVGRNEEGFEAAYHIEEVCIEGADITHVSSMEPPVNNGLRRRLRIFPISGHDILTLDNNLTLLTDRDLFSFFIANLYIHRLDNTA